ncbi:hypothetical protein [Sinorhizobium meliloti]|uniref:hypothetical protein n=1 Tax=Rhizobium meliloti TaxID=382 RepID=UPI0002DFC9A3|nr:hypothetical protein [Sinorhizobium meliloti]MDE4590859.1 hypothetical protein [Sinorhizobium meliloti]
MIPKQYAAHLIFNTLHERAAKFTPIMNRHGRAGARSGVRPAPISTGKYCVLFDPTQQKTEFIQQIQIIAKRATHWLGVAKNRLQESCSRQDV